MNNNARRRWEEDRPRQWWGFLLTLSGVIAVIDESTVWRLSMMMMMIKIQCGISFSLPTIQQQDNNNINVNKHTKTQVESSIHHYHYRIIITIVDFVFVVRSTITVEIEGERERGDRRHHGLLTNHSHSFWQSDQKCFSMPTLGSIRWNTGAFPSTFNNSVCPCLKISSGNHLWKRNSAWCTECMLYGINKAKTLFVVTRSLLRA